MRHFGNTRLPFSLCTHPFYSSRAPSFLVSFHLPQVTSFCCCFGLLETSGFSFWASATWQVLDTFACICHIFITSTLLQLSLGLFTSGFCFPYLVWIGIYVPLYGMKWGAGCRVNAAGSATLCTGHLWVEGMDLSPHLLPTSFCKCKSCSYFWLPKCHTGNFPDFSPFAGVFGIFRHLAEGYTLQACWFWAPQIIRGEREISRLEGNVRLKGADLPSGAACASL